MATEKTLTELIETLKNGEILSYRGKFNKNEKYSTGDVVSVKKWGKVKMYYFINEKKKKELKPPKQKEVKKHYGK